MKLRKSKTEDLEDILILYRELTPDDLPLDKKLAEKIYNRIIDNDYFMILVLESDSIIVASCALSIIPNLTRGGKSYAVIENVVTKKSYRNQGFGTKIMEYAIRVANEQGCYKIMLQTGSSNSSTHEFYKKLGFSNTDKTAYVIKQNVPKPAH